MIFPPQHMEIENIYAHMQMSKHRTIAISSSNPGEGTTSVAIALAQRYLLSGHSTLIIDLNLHHPSFLSEFSLNTMDVSNGPLGLPQLVSSENRSLSLTGITAPQDRASIMKLRKPGVLESCLDECKQVFDTIIVDTSPLNRINSNNIPAERVAAACESTLMVVLAGQTREASISSATQRLKNAGARLSGSVINDRYNPHLKSELLRETKRLEPFLKRVATYLQGHIERSHFLSLTD